MNRALIKIKVRRYRERGYTYPEICNKLKIRVPKSTMSVWCKDLYLSEEYKEKAAKLTKINLANGRMLAKIANKKKRDELLHMLSKKNLHLLKKVDKNVQKLLLCVLYLAEGSKHKSTRHLSLGSSSPGIIMFYLELLKNCYNIQDKKFRVRIQCRDDQNIQELEKFWQKATRINADKFYPTYKDKRTIGKATIKKDYKGVCVISYFDTKIQLELELLANNLIKHIIKGL